MPKNALNAVLLFVAGCFCLPLAALEEGKFRPISYDYPALTRTEAGPALDWQAVPVADPRLAFLLDIPESALVDKKFWPERDLWDRLRNGFAIPDIASPLLADRERWYAQRRDLVLTMSEKARRYLHHIVESVERRKLPLELALLPMVESGFEPAALSSAQAAGLWQFIPGTATRYRLAQNEHYDARRDIIASTEAALDYLEFLFAKFHDWHLALAGYNWGEEAVARAVARNQAKGLPIDFDHLVMPEETRYYVPKLLALRNLVLDPEAYAISLAEIADTPYFAEIDVAVALDVDAVARMANLSANEVRALNPSHKSMLISGKGKPALLLPVERLETFRDSVAAWRSARQPGGAAPLSGKSRIAPGGLRVATDKPPRRM